MLRLISLGFTLLGVPVPSFAQEIAGNPEVQRIMEEFQGRGTLADDTPPTPADAALETFAARADLTLDLMAAEPDLKQPLAASWDSQGRMWVVQYRQYPFPAGLKVVSYDSHLRAEFDKVPLPPPHGEAGADRITLFEDRDGDGDFDHHQDSITGLNIASSVLVGNGRIWVLNPPYLLSYPDGDRDGQPDADPVVELRGFGLEDTHSVATSLTWGMDGWIYGANGSTTTGRVSSSSTRSVAWEGQCIWRFHPETRHFEIYAEGGGNTFSLEIDSKGRVLSGTNNGRTRGMHYEQGSYGKKNWGKHGPLTNPYAFGFFQHMSHEGDDRRFAQAFAIYEGGLLGSAYDGKVVAPNSLANQVHLSRLEADGSSFRTIDEAPLLESHDRWFRPVWTGIGPDGAIYLADWYDTRLSHVSPKDDWHKSSGRLYRLRPKTAKPGLPRFNLSTAEPAELLRLLEHPNKWFRQRAVLEIGWRRLESLAPELKTRLTGSHALEAMWALDGLGLLDAAELSRLLQHEDPYVRRWAVKTCGEDPTRYGESVPALLHCSQREPHPEVQAQLLASAKRLPVAAAVELIEHAMQRDSGGDDRLPLLAWWALEAHLTTSPEAVVTHLTRRAPLMDSPAFATHLAGRAAQRLAHAGRSSDFKASAKLLANMTETSSRTAFIGGLAEAFSGGTLPELPAALEEALHRHIESRRDTSAVLALRAGVDGATEAGIQLLRDADASDLTRVEMAQALAELQETRALPVLLDALSKSQGSLALRRGYLQAAARFDTEDFPEWIVSRYEKSIAGEPLLREDALRAMASRSKWARMLIEAVNQWRIPARHVTLDLVRQLQLHDDPSIAAAIDAHWRSLLITAPSEAREREMKRIIAAIANDSPDPGQGHPGQGRPGQGRELFLARCALCHRLFDEGKYLGPDLTVYDRDNPDFWIGNLVNPSQEIREGYTSYIVKTRDGRILTGLIQAQDGLGLTLKDMAGNLTLLRHEEVDDLRASPVSMMPEGLTDDLTETQLRDLLSYLMRDAE